MGKSIEPIFTPPRAGDVMRTLADIFKIKVALDYEPGVNFEEGLRRTVESFRRSTVNSQQSTVKVANGIQV